MSPVCKMADNGRFSVDQKVKVVLFYAETKGVVATQRRFRAHFGTRWAPCKQTIYRLSLGKIFQPVRINSVPDVKCFCKNKKSVTCTIISMTFRAPPCILEITARSHNRNPEYCRLWETEFNLKNPQQILVLRTFEARLTHEAHAEGKWGTHTNFSC